MIQSRGQITVFIIIGIALIFIVGAALYISSSSERQRLELAKPRVSEIPERVQPIRDAVDSCLTLILTDGLKKVGDTGGYVEQTTLFASPYASTDGDAVELAPSGQKVAYWWYMKSDDRCTQNCEFASKRPPLTKEEGRGSIEEQLQRYVTNNLPSCLAPLTELPGCTIRTQGNPEVNVDVGDISVIATANHQISATCEDQTYQVNDYAIEIPLNLRDIYDLATTVTNLQIESGILEQATNIVLSTFSGVDQQRIPPSRGLEIGSPSQGTFWIKYDVLQKIKAHLASYIPLIQVFGTRNYNYIDAPNDVRDPELYELVYNRQFLIPTNRTYKFLETRFSYLDWWQPYFDLNCNGQLCRADSMNNFAMIPLSLHRYEFAYDLSYPVLFEVRDPFAFDGEGFAFNIMLEQNMRSSRRFTSTTTLSLPPPTETIPTIFCNPDQRTSGDVEISVLSGERKRPLDDVSVSYICGTNICAIGTVRNGSITTTLPRCIGGTLQLSKANYASAAKALDTFTEDKQNIQIIMEPIRTVNATIRNYQITKPDELSPWEYETASGLIRPSPSQTAIVLLQREGLPDEEPFFTVAELIGSKPAELKIVPGKYRVQITSLYKDKIVIPSKPRCFTVSKVFSSKQKCQNVPEKDLIFNATSPFPLGTTEFDWFITADELQGAKTIEFRQYILAIDKTEEKARRIEDLEHISDPQLYTENNPILVRPVVSQ